MGGEKPREVTGSGSAVSVRIAYLSVLREQSGTRMDKILLPAGSTLSAVADWLRVNRGIAAPGSTFMSTLNGHGWNRLPNGLATEIHEGDEITLFPLLSGG